MSKARWIERPDILDYIVESYAGVEGNARRRLFIWDDGQDVKMGNVEAFVLHLAERFDLPLTARDGSRVHQLLVDLGERVRDYRSGRQAPSGTSGYRTPEPDEWTIGSRPGPRPAE